MTETNLAEVTILNSDELQRLLYLVFMYIDAFRVCQRLA